MSSIIEQITGFFTFKGFRQQIENPSAPLADRFPRGKIAILSIGPDNVFLTSANLSKGSVSFSDRVVFPGGDANEFVCSESLAEEIRRRTERNHLIVQIGQVVETSIVQNFRRNGEIADMLNVATDPAQWIGPTAKPGNRYVVLHNPTVSVSIVAGVSERFLNSVKESLFAQGLVPIRIQSSLIATLDHALAHPDVASGKANLLVVDHSALTFVKTSPPGRWESIRMRLRCFSPDGDISRAEQFLGTLGTDLERPVLLVDTGTTIGADISMILQDNITRYETPFGENLGFAVSLLK